MLTSQQTPSMLTSAKLGKLAYTPEDIIHFPQGLLGFEDIKHYLLLKTAQHSLFYFLQALSDETLCFVLVRPQECFKDYTLSCDAPSPYTHDFAIVTQREEEADPTVNLLGPVIINQTTRQGWQLISDHPTHHTRHVLTTVKKLNPTESKFCTKQPA